MTARRLLTALTLALASAAAPALGQEGTSLDTLDLRARQEALFQQMFDDPENLELMFEYALVSVELRDFESAISVLDRILIFNPDLPRVRLELGAAYFRIGSYQFAREYFVEVLEHPEATPAVRERAEAFLAAIDTRTRENYVTGSLQISGLFSTNANNGPASRDIRFLGFSARLTGDEVTAQTDVGASVNLQLTHVYDLGGVDADSWRTNLVAYAQRYASTDDGAADVFVVRTGPRLSLEDDRYGLKGRPYVEADHVRSSDDGLYSTVAAGFELRDSVGEDLLVGGLAQVGWRDYDGGGRLDGVNIRAGAAVDYFMTEATTLSALAAFEFEGADDPSERTYEFGVGGSVSHLYDSGLDIASRRWNVEASARVSARLFDEPGIADPGKTRQDFDLRLGLSNLAFLDEGFAVETRADYFLRESNIRNFDLNSLTFTVGARFLF